MQKALLLITVVLVLFVLLLFPLKFASAQHDDDVPFSTQTLLSNQHLDPNENLQVIRAFFPTGSQSQNCLVSLNDTNAESLGMVTFCAQRIDQSLGAVSGVL